MATKRALTLDDFFSLYRLSNPQISPDGKTILYFRGKPDVQKNATAVSMELVSIDGKQPRQLLPATKGLSTPRFTPDGKHVVFLSSESGKSQLWAIKLEGGEPVKLTEVSHAVNAFALSQQGDRIAFIATLWPEYANLPYDESMRKNVARAEAEEKDPVKVRTHSRLFYRHWDSYIDDTRMHLFVVDVKTENGNLTLASTPKNLTPWDRDARPNSSTYVSGDELTFSADGEHIYFTSSPYENEAWNTDFHVEKVAVTGGDPVRAFPDAKAANNHPLISPDGEKIAYRAQARLSYEADKWQLLIRPLKGGTPVSVNQNWDNSVESFAFSKTKNEIYFEAAVRARMGLFSYSLATKEITEIEKGTVEQFVVGPNDELVYLYSDYQTPPEIRVRTAEGKVTTVTRENHELLAAVDIPAYRTVDFKGANNDNVQMWLVLPPGFDEKKKYPLVYWVHGGPQAPWMSSWSYRWNPNMWAAQGYVIALPNPRGSASFGEKFKDEINCDWNGKVFEDLMKGVEYCEALPYIDKNKMAAAGGSYGGYMMNWFEGNTTKFKTLVNHCGIYNLFSMFATEELWFVESEFSGLPWERKEIYEKLSPHNHAENFKTPMLILHNERDFRCPIGEGLQVFNVLQRKGIESRFVNFVDEGHWVVRPGNSRRWHTEIFTWLKKFI